MRAGLVAANASFFSSSEVLRTATASSAQMALCDFSPEKEDVSMGPLWPIRCPPNPPYFGVTDVDLDGNRATREVFYDGTSQNLGDGTVWVLAGVIGAAPATGANSYYAGIHAKDANGNGQMDPEEAANGRFTSKCVFPRGLNGWTRSGADGHLRSGCKDRDENGRTTGAARNFDYDPKTGYIVITHTYPNGNTEVLYNGPSREVKADGIR